MHRAGPRTWSSRPMSTSAASRTPRRRPGRTATNFTSARVGAVVDARCSTVAGDAVAGPAEGRERIARRLRRRSRPGETIQYSYVLTNTGNVDLTSLSVSDPTGGAVTCPTPTAPGPGARGHADVHGEHAVRRHPGRRRQRRGDRHGDGDRDRPAGRARRPRPRRRSTTSSLPRPSRIGRQDRDRDAGRPTRTRSR